MHILGYRGDDIMSPQSHRISNRNYDGSLRVVFRPNTPVSTGHHLHRRMLVVFGVQ